MNALENYIIEVYSERECKVGDTLMMCIKVLVDCYGHKSEKEVTMSRTDWENAKRKGYFVS